MKVYICGDRNYPERFKEAERYLLEEGHSPINPLNIVQVLPKEITNAEFTVLAFEIIRISDAIYLISGWEKDLLARMEISQARRAEKEILNKSMQDSRHKADV